MATADWIKEAEEQAKKYSDSIKTSNQYLIDQLNKARDNSLAQLEASNKSALENLQRQQDNALYNLNTQKSDIYRTANDNAQQLNINRLLNLKDNQYAMNRAGLGTQGLVGSQVNSINNNYGRNLTDVLNQRVKDLNNLALQRENTNLGYDTSRINLGNTYNTNRLNLENEYGNNIANLQREIESQALNQYNNVYNNYLNLKQQEYQNEQNRLAQEEAIRQWEAELALKQAAQDEAKRQWQLEYELAKKTSNKNRSGSTTGSSSKTGVSFTDTTPEATITTDNSNNKITMGDLLSPSKLLNKLSGNNTKTSSNNSKMSVAGMMGALPIYSDGKNYYLYENNTYVKLQDNDVPDALKKK